MIDSSSQRQRYIDYIRSKGSATAGDVARYMKISANEVQETTMQPVLMLEGIVYLPHYVQVNRWCGPGITEPFTTEELISQGAVWGTYPLWPRRWTELLWTTQNL